jgi:hypothetical protein
LIIPLRVSLLLEKLPAQEWPTRFLLMEWELWVGAQQLHKVDGGAVSECRVISLSTVAAYACRLSFIVAFIQFP